jgi:enamine deaminase RidA (YjgF/YER057c/UK114 family)
MWKQNLARLGLELPQSAVPAGAYVPAKCVGDLVFVAGQLPFRDGELLCTGPVDLENENQAVLAARQCFFNCLAAAAEASIAAGRELLGVARLGVFVQCTSVYTKQAFVANGASELALELFGEDGKHARAAVGSSSLPRNTSVEVEAVFILKSQ